MYTRELSIPEESPLIRNANGLQNTQILEYYYRNREPDNCLPILENTPEFRKNIYSSFMKCNRICLIRGDFGTLYASFYRLVKHILV